MIEELRSQTQADELPNSTAAADAQVLLDLYNTTLGTSPNIPSFFEQIMMCDMDGMTPDPTQPPPTLSTWMPESEWFETMDLFGTEFAPIIDQTVDDQQILNNFFSSPIQNASSVADVDGQPLDDGAQRRHAIFQQSPWLWVPDRNQNAFSEHVGPLLDERNVDITTPPHEPCAANIAIPDRLSQQTRDRIFQLVSKTAQGQIAVPSFPSSECIDKLIKVGIAKRTETDAWIHPFTFCSESSMPEFVTALVAAGCVCFGIPIVSQTGLILQELVRIALCRLSEADNSVIRELNFMQASMIYLDIGAFCGYKRKMEIAESNLQPLVTALRRTGRFDRVAYRDITPTANDDDDQIESKWRAWAEQESFKRLVYHLFEHDISMTLVKHRSPLISYSEVSTPLPAPRSLWLSPTASAWKTRWLATKYSPREISLQDLLRDESVMRCLTPEVDEQVARSAFLYGLAAQVWEHNNQALILRTSNDASSRLWLQTRQQKLEQSLLMLDILPEKFPAIMCVVHQFSLMLLHTNLDLITRFAGKCGEDEARRAYTQLQPWSQTKEARIAVSHASQILRAVKAIPPYQIRGQDSFMLYHAIMVLWTYSMMIKGQAKRTATNTPARGQTQTGSMPTGGEFVFLDDLPSPNSACIDNFILNNVGTICLRFPTCGRQPSATATTFQKTSSKPAFCELRSPAHIMAIGVAILEATHPDVDRQNGPPLIKALCGLMEELGNLR